MADLTLTDAQNGSTMQARVGDTITLVLAENPTTGYQWSVQRNNAAVLSATSDDYASASQLPGGGGTHTFVFKAVAPGTSALDLVNARSWEQPSTANAHYRVTIQVRDR